VLNSIFGPVPGWTGGPMYRTSGPNLRNYFFIFFGWRWHGRAVWHGQTVPHFCPAASKSRNVLTFCPGWLACLSLFASTSHFVPPLWVSHSLSCLPPSPLALRPQLLFSRAGRATHLRLPGTPHLRHSQSQCLSPGAQGIKNKEVFL